MGKSFLGHRFGGGPNVVVIVHGLSIPQVVVVDTLPQTADFQLGFRYMKINSLDRFWVFDETLKVERYMVILFRILWFLLSTKQKN